MRGASVGQQTAVFVLALTFLALTVESAVLVSPDEVHSFIAPGDSNPDADSNHNVIDIPLQPQYSPPIVPSYLPTRRSTSSPTATSRPPRRRPPEVMLEKRWHRFARARNQMSTRITHEALVELLSPSRIRPDLLYESKLDPCEMAAYRGYPCEEHNVTTRDGYVLTLHRIPRGTRGNKLDKDPVILQHGLLDTGFTWVANFPPQSLAFILADAGFDVWLSNSRGNYYSHSHVKYSSNDRRYWLFSFDEMARYDLPAVVEYVSETTRREQVYYVGHSQGTLIGFAGFSNNPLLASRVKLFAALCPVARVANIQGLAAALVPYARPVAALLELHGTGEFLPDNELTRGLATQVCGRGPILDRLCAEIFFLLDGFGDNNINVTRVPVYFSHFPAGTSALNMVHFAQGVTSERFAKMDYGDFFNRLIYAQDKPPEYDLTRVHVPTALFWSDNDLLADRVQDARFLGLQELSQIALQHYKSPMHVTQLDVEWLLTQLPEIVFNRRYDDYGHAGFVWSTYAHEDIYIDLLIQLMLY